MRQHHVARFLKGNRREFAAGFAQLFEFRTARGAASEVGVDLAGFVWRQFAVKQAHQQSFDRFAIVHVVFSGNDRSISRSSFKYASRNAIRA